MIRGTSNSFGVPYERRPEDTVPSEDEIVDYGEETWEVSFNSPCFCKEQADIQSILRYMVSSGLSNGMIANRPRDSVLQLLLSSGLMADM